MGGIERRDLDQARRSGVLWHAPTSSTVGGLDGRLMRDAAARISPESLVAIGVCAARVMRDNRGRLARFHAVTSESSSEIVRVPYDQAYGRGFEDMLRRVPDIGKIRSLIGFEPVTSLDQILGEVIAERQRAVSGKQALAETSVSN